MTMSTKRFSFTCPSPWPCRINVYIYLYLPKCIQFTCCCCCFSRGDQTTRFAEAGRLDVSLSLSLSLPISFCLSFKAEKETRPTHRSLKEPKLECTTTKASMAKKVLLNLRHLNPLVKTCFRGTEWTFVWLLFELLPTWIIRQPSASWCRPAMCCFGFIYHARKRNTHCHWLMVKRTA